MGSADGVSGGKLTRLRIGQRGLGPIVSGYGGIPLLLADYVFFYQRLVTREIGIGLGEVGLGLGNCGMRAGQLLLGLLNAGMRSAHVCVR